MDFIDCCGGPLPTRCLQTADFIGLTDPRVSFALSPFSREEACQRRLRASRSCHAFLTEVLAYLSANPSFVIESLSRPRRPLSQGSGPSGYPPEPLVSYQTNRQLSGWNLLHW